MAFEQYPLLDHFLNEAVNLLQLKFVIHDKEKWENEEEQNLAENFQSFKRTIIPLFTWLIIRAEERNVLGRACLSHPRNSVLSAKGELLSELRAILVNVTKLSNEERDCITDFP